MRATGPLLNLSSLLSGDMMRIRNVIRFSNSTRIKDETVAEHSYFTAYYALVLACTFSAVYQEHLDYEEILSSAIMHDVDEAKSGDFVRHFKYSDKELKSKIEQVTDELMDNAMMDLYNPERKSEARPPAMFLHTRWRYAKNDTLEGDIVAFADFLSVLSYVVNEIACGNKKIIEQLDDMYEYAKSFYNRHLFQKYEEPKMWLEQSIVILNKYIGTGD